MNQKLLLLIESNTTGTGRQFAQRAAQHGLTPVLVSADPSRYPYAAQDGLRTVVADTADGQALTKAAEELSNEGEIAGVLSSSEYYIAAAAELAAQLGLPGPSASAVRAVRDKHHQRRALAAAGVPVPRSTLVESVSAALAAAAHTGYPVVVKPVQGSGSLGVRLCRNTTELTEHVGELLAVTVNERGLAAPSRALVEEYLDGPEFSVEVFGTEALTVVAKHVGPHPVFVETGHDVPAALPAAAARALRASAVRAVQALGLGWGAAHVELRLNGESAAVIEVNPRLAGGMIPELVRQAHGVDLVRAQVLAALGENALAPSPVQLTPAPLTPGSGGTGSGGTGGGGTGGGVTASIRFLTTDHDGLLGDAATMAGALIDAAAVPGVYDVSYYRAPGEPVGPAEDFRGRFGHVIATGPDARSSAAAAELSLCHLAGAVTPALAKEEQPA